MTEEMAAAGAVPAGEHSPAADDLARYGVPVSYSRGQAVLHPERAGYLDLIEALRADGFNQCVDITAVDYLAHPSRPLPEGVARQRFELVVNLISYSRRQRLRLRIQVPEAEPSVPSLFRIFPGTEAMEREVFDMMGIVFTGHPDLTRILMPEDWEGHPLRKDYSVGRVPVQFKQAPSTR
ncbi:MAG TPA: NADH-quinone oxidoreductase subunit C [Acidimicrobiales bacterium]|nr:NADH-quinone oxidoreductase subunit C [Acidimicrobiales bacterium]